MTSKYLIFTAASIAASMTALQAADYVKGYNKGSGSQLLLANGGAGAVTFVDEATTGGGDMSANAGNPTWGWEIDGTWALNDAVEFTGIAMPIWANEPTTDATGNTQNATHRIKFYSCGANDAFDGTANDTLLGTVDVNFTSADAGVDEYYVNFDAPVVWAAADSTKFYFHIQALELPSTARAMRFKTGPANSGAAVIKRRTDGTTQNVAGSSTTYLTVAGSVNQKVWHGDAGADGTADWDAISSNWDGGGTLFTDGSTAFFNEAFDGDSSLVNLVGSLSPAAIVMENTSIGAVPEYEFTGTGSLTGVTNLGRFGDGTLTISNVGPNDYTGGTAIGEGTIKLGVADGISPAGSLTIGGQSGISTLMLNGFDQSVTDLNSAGANIAEVVNGSSDAVVLTVSNGGVFSGELGNSTLAIDDDANNFRVVKEGAGTLNLVGANNSYSGSTTVTGGAFMISGDGALGGAPVVPTADSIVLDGGTLRAHMAVGTGGSFAVDPNRLITLGSNGGTIQTTTPSGAWTVTYDGVISGSGSLTKASAQTLVLGGENTYTGATTVTSGSLRLTGSLVSDVTVQAGTFSSGTAGVGSGSVAGLTFGSGGNLQYFFDSSTLSGALTTVTGAVAIDPGANLALVDVAGSPVELALGEKVTVLDYTGGTLTGNFLGLPEGGRVLVGSNTFAISYDDDSKVTLTAADADVYAAWAVINITGGAPAGFEDDADGDGIENGIEFILGSNPLVADSSNLPTCVMDATNLTIAYTRTGESVSATTQFVEWSVNLEDWNPIEVTDPSTTVSVDIPLSNAVDGKLFARLRATNP